MMYKDDAKLTYKDFSIKEENPIEKNDKFEYNEYKLITSAW